MKQIPATLFNQVKSPKVPTKEQIEKISAFQLALSVDSKLKNLNFFFLQLQQLTKTRLYEKESVIIFDEVQLLPKTRQAIKYLVADGRYKYIETGSLLSIKKNTQDILIPSEEHKISMYPIDFEEFLWAINDDITADTIKMLLKSRKAAGNAMHQNLMRIFRRYMLIGGMPQAIEAYIEHDNLQMVDTIKREILDLYEEDFTKIDKKGLAGDIFCSIPASLTIYFVNCKRRDKI